MTEFKARCIGGNTCLYCKTDHEPIVGELTDPKGEPATVTWLKGHGIALHALNLYLYVYGSLQPLSSSDKFLCAVEQWMVVNTETHKLSKGRESMLSSAVVLTCK